MQIQKASLYFTFIAFLILSGCSSSKQIKDGNIAFQQKSYTLAANLFKSEYGKETDPTAKAFKAFMAGESYRLSNNPQQAEKWYLSAVNMDFNPIAKFNYGLMLKINEKYEMAITAFTQFAREEPFKKQDALDQIKACRQAMKWQFIKNPMTIKNMKYLNTTSNEYGPVLNKNKDLLFTSDRLDASGGDIYGWTGEKYTDIFLSKRSENDEFKSIVPFSSKINSGFNEGTPTFNDDYTLMYFTRCGAQGKEDDYCKIYESTIMVTGDWSIPEVVAFFDDTINEGNPWLSGDGNTLIFASNAPGYGGKDLFVSYFDGSSWTQAENLGGTVNSTGDDMFPSLDADGNLYFSSNGHVGMGGLDIFKAEKDGKKWNNISNLKPPINTGADDFAIIFEKTKAKDKNDPIRSKGYFSSARKGGMGGDDLYSFMLANRNIFQLEGIVLVKIHEDPTDPNSKVVDYQPVNNAHLSLKKYGLGFKTVDTVSSNKYGKFEMALEAETDYKLFTKKEGFFNKSLDLSTKGLRDLKKILITLRVRILIDKIYEEQEIILSNIYYDYDKTTLRDESMVVLDTLTILLEENPSIFVELGSHTDSRGSNSYNEVLSHGRAESVVNYLIENGIATKRLRAKGYGESKLINDCGDNVDCSEEEHQKNRRTTFKVLSEKSILESIEPENIRVDPKK